MDKRELRTQIRNRIATLSDEQRDLASRSIFEQVERLDEFITADVVALYAALPDEPQSMPSIAKWSRDKRIVLPRVEGDVMRFYDYAPKQMQSGAFGINEPQGLTPCPPEEIELMVVPGVAFTPEGKRMGRGKGFYDKYLSQSDFCARTVGVCFREQVVNDIPTDHHDRCVDKVIFND